MVPRRSASSVTSPWFVAIAAFIAIGNATACRAQPAHDVAQQPSGDVTYSLSNNSRDIIFRASWGGGLSGLHMVRTLYGDGRLEIQNLEAGGRKVRKSAVVRLPASDIASLFDHAAKARLFEMDQATLLAGVAADLGRPGIAVADGSVVTLEFNVLDLQRGGESVGSRSSRLSLYSPWSITRAAPTNGPAAAFVAILQILSRAEASRAQSKQETPQ